MEKRASLARTRAQGKINADLAAVALTALQFPDEPGAAAEQETDRWLVPRKWFEVEDTLSAVAAVPVSFSGESYFLLGDAMGMLQVYQFPSKKLMQYDTQHGCAVTSIGFGKRDDSLLVTGAADGTVHIHELRLPRKERPKRRPRVKGASPLPPPPPSFTSLTLELKHKVPAVESAPAETAPQSGTEATCIQVYRRLRVEMIVVGDAAGHIRVLFSNGTQFSVTKADVPMTAMLTRSARFPLPIAAAPVRGPWWVAQNGVWWVNQPFCDAHKRNAARPSTSGSMWPSQRAPALVSSI